MVRKKMSNSIRRTAAPDDGMERGLESGWGSREPQKETEKVTIPDGGEVQLQRSNVLPTSIEVSGLSADRDFEGVEDQNFGPGQYFFLPEEGVLFFNPSDAGIRVQIEYLWRELEDSEESTEDLPLPSNDSSEEEEDLELDDDDDEDGPREKKPAGKTLPSDSLWHLDQEWFKWKPLDKKVKVNNSLQAKLEKGLDLKRGLTVRNAETGKELDVILTGLDKSGKPRREPKPGEVAYNYDNGILYWGDSSASGNTYVVEYFLVGQQGEPVTMAGEEGEEKEFNLVESFKSRAENLWTSLLDNPNPDFVRETLVPIIEDELESARDEVLKIKSEPKREQALKNFPDLTREFMELEQLLAKREENDDEDVRRMVRDFIESDVSPKLSRFYSLASLLAERSYDMQSEEAKDEDFPEFGSSGARAIDLNTLKYLKRVRQEANTLDRDLIDFSKYYTGLLVSWIRDPDTYYPTNAPGKRKKDTRWEGIKDIFERAGIGLADLQAVALEAFRRAIIGFDRETRDKEKTPDPKKFRVYGSPAVKRRVTNALKALFDKHQLEQTVESTTRAGTKTVTIPEDGGEVDLGVPGLRVENLQVKGESGDLFTSSRGVLMATQAEGRKSPRVKISLGKKHDKDAQVSLSDPETGKKLSIIRSKDHPWNSDLKKKVASDPEVFYFAHSTGTLWLSEAYRGKSLLVEAPSVGGEGSVGKNQYLAHPTRGTLEFSSLNAGEKVEVSYSQTIRAKRYVNPIVKSDEEGEETSFIEMKEDEGADPLSKAEESVSQESVDQLLDVIAEIVTVEEDPRLNDEERAILQGLLGLGEAGGQRLTIQEIAAREPFNFDVTNASKVNQVKAKRQKAANTLLEILRERAEDDPTLRKMIRPFESVLLGKDGGREIDNDKFLGYLNNSQDNRATFQNVLVGVLGKAGLKQDEENILRWMWALPGKLRRDQEAEDKKYESPPGGLEPATSPGARLQEIAIDEFNIEADDDGNISQTATEIVNKVYERALGKFVGKFNSIYDGRKDFFVERYPDFVQYYDRQRGKQSLRDELATIERDEFKSPVSVDKPKETLTPLFDKIKSSITGVDDEMLRSLMEELLAAHKKGKSLGTLIQQRQKDIDSLTAQSAAFLDKKTKDLRSEITSLQKAITDARSEVAVIDDSLSDFVKERKKLEEEALADNTEIAKKKKKIHVLDQIVSLLSAGKTRDLFHLFSPKNIQSMPPEDQEVYQDYDFLRNASNEDLKEAEEDLRKELEEEKSELRELREKAISLANKTVRKNLRDAQEKIDGLTSRKTKFFELLVEQESALKGKKEQFEKKITPLQKKVEEHLQNHNATKEMKALQKVQNFLSDREDLQRSDGTYNIDNMFEVPKLEKGKGYKAPKLSPEDEDTFKPLPKSETGPGKTLKNRPALLDPAEPPPEPKATRSLTAPGEAEREQSRFAPRSKEPPTEFKRTLFDELRAVAVPLDPDESRDAYRERIENFRKLMKALSAHFAEGKSIVEFKPKFSAADTLRDQNKALRRVAEYLIAYGSDLKKSPGVWDLKDLFRPTIVKPIDPVEKKVDLSGDESAIEALLNSQPSLSNKEQAAFLHQTMKRINRGTPLLKIIKGLQSSKNSASSSLGLVVRLGYFMSLHEDLKKDEGKWNFRPLYNGTKRFPSFEEYDRSRPLENHIAPLIKAIQRNLQEEAGAEGGIESASGTEQRVLDVIHRMSELALHGMDLDQIEAHFEKEDKQGAKDYSLTYLFQQIRNFLTRLNQAKGLANMRDDMGLSGLFGPGAPAGTPTERDEVKAPSEEQQAQLLPEDDRTTAFRQMVHISGMDEKEAATAQKLVSSLQLRMESGDKVASELLGSLLTRTPQFAPVIKKVLSFIGANRAKFESGIPGVPDLSTLTGMPFKHPHVTPASEPEPASTEVPPLQEILKEKVEQVPDEKRKELRKSVFEEFLTENELGSDPNERNLFADAVRLLKDNGSKSGIEKLIGKTQGTQLEGVFELLIEFFREKGLVDTNGLPDFRGVSIPALEGREPFFAKDGTPNLEQVEEKTPEFDADDISAEMPEPRADLEEHADDLADELGGEPQFDQDLQDAVDFLKSDQVKPLDDSALSSASKSRLKRIVWGIMEQEFSFEDDERQDALEVLMAVQKQGLDKTRLRLKGKDHLSALLEDLVDFIKEQGLGESDIADIRLPEPEAEDAEEVDLTIEELMGEKPKKTPTRKFTPTVRSQVSDDLVQETLDAAQKAQGKSPGSNTFSVVDVIRGLEGKVSPEDAKNALLQASEQGLVELHPVAGDTLSDDAAKFIPVAADGAPMASGHVLKMPGSSKSPQPAQPVESEKPDLGTATGVRGRLPSTLTSRATGPEVYKLLSQKAGITDEESAVLHKEVADLENLTYSQVSKILKSEKLSEAARHGLERYFRWLTSYLRAVQGGKDPLNKTTTSPEPAKPGPQKNEWRQHPATEKQLSKVETLVMELREQGHQPQVNLNPETKGEASDIINALKRMQEQAGQLEESVKPKSAPPAPAKTPAPASPKSPGAPSSRDDRANLQRLLEKALQWSTDKEATSAQAFKFFLAKVKPGLVPLYERIMPEVQKMLDAIHSSNDLDFDLNDL